VHPLGRGVLVLREDVSHMCDSAKTWIKVIIPVPSPLRSKSLVLRDLKSSSLMRIIYNLLVKTPGGHPQF